MTDLERFVGRLVELLEARDPTGRFHPINIAELRTSIMPYRLNRSALGLSSHEDYELLVLRLVAEEGGFARTNPPESAARCREEASSPNPDLEIVEDLNDTTIQFGAAGLARHSALGTRHSAVDAPEAGPVSSPWAPEVVPELPAAPPLAPEAAPVEAAPEPTPAPTPEPPAERRVPSAECRELACRDCHRPLPTHREVTFCPYCGSQVGQSRCGRCGAEIEPGWRHCVSCGAVAGHR